MTGQNARRRRLVLFAIIAWMVCVAFVSVVPFLVMFWIWEPGGDGIWMFGQGAATRYAPVNGTPQPSFRVEVLVWHPGIRNWLDFRFQDANSLGIRPRVPPHLLVFPPWLVLGVPTVLVVVPLSVRSRLHGRANHPDGRGACPACGYDATGLAVCPECGVAIEAEIKSGTQSESAP